MTTSFSWSDTVQIAFSSCLPCLTSRNSDAASASTDSLLDPDRNNPTAHRIPRARPDELQGLLLPRVDPDTDTDAERMSLHSNPSGRSTRRGGAVKSTTNKKKKKKASTTGGSQKRITVLGYNLFGKRAGVLPPIYLPESDDDDEGEGESTSALAAPLARTRSSSSGSTFDSDAAPLDLAAIENLTGSSSAIAAAAREEEERRLRGEKVERRARRREKREMKRLARTLEGGEGFEGFPGSTGAGSHGSYHRGMPSFEGYGPFVSAQSPGPTKISHQQPIYRDDGVDRDEDDADLDGQVYARRSRDPGYGSRSGSDSRSRTSATSRSDGPTPVAPGFPGIASGAGQGFQPPPSPGMLAPGQKNLKSSKSKSKGSSSSSSSNTSRSKLKSTSSTASDHTSRGTRSNTSASTSQSPSLPSPTSVTFGLGVSPPPPPEGGPHGYAPTFSKLSAGHGVGGHEDDAFDGSQGLTDADMLPSSPGFRIEGGGGGGFPSSGLGLGLGRGPRHGRGGDSILEKGGAFLATRGGGAYAG